MCDKYGHITRVCRSRSHNMNEPQANFPSTTGSTNPYWVMDTGASHHITSHTQNLQSYSEYTRTDDVIVGDGNDVLCAPTIHRNLISDLRTRARLAQGPNRTHIYEWTGSSPTPATYITPAANFSSRTLWHRRLDGGGEYEGLTKTLANMGIQHLFSPPYTPQRVGTAERRH
ncbi:hypothetical protein KY289_030784 [Solanum tuberosum]|nr:hypothetical protein KY289_030784 [Solanum tuberosum]